METKTIVLCASKTVCTTLCNKISVENIKMNPRFLEPIIIQVEEDKTLYNMFSNFNKIFSNDRN